MKQILTLIAILISINLVSAQELYDQELKKLYSQKQYEKVIERGKVILEKEPNNITANHLIGRVLANKKNFKEAIPYLQNSIQESSPNYIKSWSYAYLGKCNFELDNYSQAKNDLEKVIELNATENSNKEATKYMKWFQMTDKFDNWEIIDKDYIRFHFQPNHNIKNIDKYCEQRVEAYKTNNEFFNAEPFKKIDYFVWSNPDEAKEYFGKPLGFSNSELCIINSRINQTIGHEITHILSDLGIRPEQKGRLLNEGIAVVFDLTDRNRIELARKSNPDNLSIKQIIEDQSELSDGIIYNVGGALIEFLKEKSDDETLKRLIKNQTYENLIILYGENTIIEFEQKIKN